MIKFIALLKQKQNPTSYEINISKVSEWGVTKLLTQIHKIFATLSPKILRLFRLKVLF